MIPEVGENETSTPDTRLKTDEITGFSGGAPLAGICESNPDASAIASTDLILPILTLGPFTFFKVE